MTKKKSPIKLNLIILFIILFLFSILTPIPYYQSEVICITGQTCPKAGWYWGRSIVQLIIYSLNNTSETENNRVDKIDKSTIEEELCGGIAGIICPNGYFCKYYRRYPDVGGKCVKK